jgi:hypothetical protein
VNVKSIVFNATCLLSSNSSKDKLDSREDLNSWLTRTGTFTPERSLKAKDTALYSALRCRKNNPPTECSCHAYLTLSDNSLILIPWLHTPQHPADNAAPQNMESLARVQVVQRSRATASGSAQHMEAKTSEEDRSERTSRPKPTVQEYFRAIREQ